jgi:hypothetical protein
MMRLASQNNKTKEIDQVVECLCETLGPMHRPKIPQEVLHESAHSSTILSSHKPRNAFNVPIHKKG